MNDARLHLQGIHRSFGGRQVLSGVDLSLLPGEILGLLGPNGAGKSTLIAIADGSLAPDSGTVTVDGIDLATHRATAARRIGSAPQRLGVYPTLTLRDNVEGFARLHGVRGRALRSRSAEVIASLGLTDHADVRADRLSGGQQRRLHLAMALTHRPRLLFLDEPTVGADVESRRQILDLVRRVAADGASVVYTTHYLTELEQLPARIALLHRGALVDLGDVRALVAARGGTRLTVHLGADVAAPTGWEAHDGRLVSTSPRAQSGALLAELLGALGEDARSITEVQFPRESLESAYLNLLADAGTTPAGAEVPHAAA